MSGSVDARDDPFDEVRVVGEVFVGEGEPAEYTIVSTGEFGPTVQTAAEGLTDFCDLVSSGDPEDDWSTDLGAG